MAGATGATAAAAAGTGADGARAGRCTGVDAADDAALFGAVMRGGRVSGDRGGCHAATSSSTRDRRLPTLSASECIAVAVESEWLCPMECVSECVVGSQMSGRRQDSGAQCE